MKKYLCISILCLLISSFSNMAAQEKINVTIKKVVENGENKVEMTIENNNLSKIIIMNKYKWDGAGDVFIMSPTSYIQFVGNPTAGNRVETGKIIFTKSIAPNQPENGTSNIILNPQTAYIDVFRIFGETFNPQRSFASSQKSQVKRLQVKLTLTYFYMSTGKGYTKTYFSNTINL